MRTGSETLESIEDALRDLRGQEQLVRGELEKAGAERSNLMAKRLKAFKELARVRTRNALADGVIDQADRLSEQVEGILKARLKTVKALNRRANKAEKSRDEQLQAHQKLLAAIEELEAKLDDLADKARRYLKDNPDYIAAGKTSAAANAVYDKAATKTRQAALNRDEKGASFESDPLFSYLWRRGYGGKSYKPNRLIKWLDGMVANLVGYHDARANYAVLNEIPVRLAEHVERLGQRAREAQEAVDAIEAARIHKLAGSDLPKKLAEARQRQTALHATLEQLAGELSETISQINTYAECRDRSFAQAAELSAGFLEQESLIQLRALARRSAEPSDDQIVTRIRNMERKIDAFRTSNQELQSKLDTLFKRKEELIRLTANFRHSYYDDSSSIFTPGTDMDDLLRLLLRGAITAAEYWVRAQRGHGWRNRPADPFRRNSSLPPLGGGFGWTSGGGLGSGRIGRGRSGADFKTGGGF